MKLASISLSTLALVLSASPLMAANLNVQANLITSQGSVDSEKAEATLSNGQVIKEKVEGSRDYLTAPGVGITADYQLIEGLRVGAGVSYVDYKGEKATENKDGKQGFTDTAFSVNSSYDFYKVEALSLYGLGGLSYHMVNIDDLDKVEYKDSQLLNYDLGLGGRYAVSDAVNIGLSYKYSDTLAKGEVKVSGVINEDLAGLKFKDVSLQQNEFIASVGYSF